MIDTTRVRRRELTAARKRSGLTQDAAAEKVGVTRTTFARWERGEQDVRPEYRRRLTEVFAVSGDEVERWIDGARSQLHASEAVRLGLDYHYSLERAVANVVELWKSDVDPVRRRMLVGAAYEVSALATPVTRWLLNSDDRAAGHRGLMRFRPQDATEVRDAARFFAEWDSRYGGGSMRVAATAYLDARVSPLLRQACNGPVRYELFSAAAQLARVVGWSAFDTDLHGLAQRHLVQALRLAQEAEDVSGGAGILATLSDQARYLRHPWSALDLARAGQRAASTDAKASARCYLSEARAHAWLVRHGDASAESSCVRALGRAEDALSLSVAPGVSAGIGLDEGKVATEAAHACLDLGFHTPERWAREAQLWAERALDLRGATYTRGRSLTKLTLSRAHLQQNDLEAACSFGTEVLDEVRGLTSTHPQSYILEFQDELGDYRDDARVQAFNEKALELLS